MECDWRLFVDNNKDCLICDNYPTCRSEKIKNDPEYRKSFYFLTDGVVEDDAKEYSAFLKEWDRVNEELLLDELGIERQPAEERDVEEEPKKQTKSYVTLKPIMTFLEAENVPFIYNEPNDLFVSYFMMVSYVPQGNGLALRLTSMSGTPTGTKFMKQIYKSEANKKQYKYVKRADFQTLFPIIRSVVYHRKSSESLS